MKKKLSIQALEQMNKKLDELANVDFHQKRDLFDSLAFKSAKFTGTSSAFLIVLAFTFIWLILGPFFSFSGGWQNIMETISGSITFLMVFSLQRSQNKDTLAMQIKLNEIIGALKGANNSLISIENLGEKEMMELNKKYEDIATELNKSKEHTTHAVKTHELAEKIAETVDATHDLVTSVIDIKKD